ncbi:NAD-dependent epimerase/dehydratase family protein [Georgenia wutianyii]|uniref:NAD-dependent epimerase/dehydratase family protein n=1 Tax=Georgenia wutianyii TaxID=2585135 RepID=A0ABX5VJW1_9MICO|nr:NAD(P)H-binding protein [Georgenia wutianyii]QDB78722.1 NAD-dependent epimerase/dehydratase family protein [Georgenia wutianyii]
MYAIAGASGRVGSAAADHLLRAGRPVRVLVRRPEAAAAWEARGAQARLVDLHDEEALAEALTGCTGLFALLPFDLTVEDGATDARAVAGATAGAVRRAGVPHVVVLSSGGADLPGGTGPIAGLHVLEESLRATGARVSALRSGHFQEKVGDVLDVARAEGVYPVFAASADVPHPMGATRDLGVVVARTLLAPAAADEVVDVLGPEYTEREVAAVLGAALGRELAVVPLPEEAWAPTLAATGLPMPVAESLAELYRADEQGLLAPRGGRTVRLTTPLEDTVAALVAAAPVPQG